MFRRKVYYAFCMDFALTELTTAKMTAELAIGRSTCNSCTLEWQSVVRSDRGAMPVTSLHGQSEWRGMGNGNES